MCLDSYCSEKEENIREEDGIIPFRLEILSSGKSIARLYFLALAFQIQTWNRKKQTAYPLFYDVKPSEVRHQEGSVGEAFEKYVKKKAAGRWRDAMEKAADLSGWELGKTFDGDEAKFIQKIVEDISPKLHIIISNFKEKLVGMETRVKKVVSSLGTGSDDVRMIGIKGMGGAGKTTLARAVFYDESFRFEGKSFVENVREASKGSGLKELQEKVLNEVFDDNDTVVKDVFEGESMMRRRMRSRKVLLVLDDVDDIDQLKALAGATTWFKPGSRIIITTRGTDPLLKHKVDVIHDVDLLSEEEAIRLFLRCAFEGGVPTQEYEELSRKALLYAQGLPLTIKVLGSSLCDKTAREWKKTIKRLNAILWKPTLEILELSYNGLDDEQKNIFLDVACILKGEQKDKAKRILKSCGYHAELALKVFEQRSLITVSDTGHLGLHGHIEEMGWDIVRRVDPDDPSKHSRLWIKEENKDILVDGLGTEATKSIKLSTMQLSLDTIMKGLTKMTKLRLLYLDSGNQTDVCTSPFNHNIANLPNSLQCVCWHGYSLSCLPKSFQAKKLVNLEMSESSISQLSEGGEIKILKKLRFLDLKVSKLRNFDLGKAQRLETLDLRGCNEFVELNMPDKLLKLKFLNLSGSKLSNLNLGLTPNLVELYLEGCDEFEELQMLDELLKLKLLDLGGSKVSSLAFGLTPHLEKLTLSTKEKLLPDDICMLKNLKYLKLKSCRGLKQLPEDICKLECLEELHLIDCSSLRSIPDSICMIKCLKNLHLPYIGAKKLPEEVGGFRSLKELNIEGARINHLPESLFKLKGLYVVCFTGLLESHGFTFFTKISDYTATCYL
ncbi:disease resistance protein RUN1-like [Bidens hawaiensis]|uniref:disease resistance protein RUN1-like n=1 Tax=Bidens hawaiensis TaxID=980011 RepID=UPI0040491057